MTASLHAFIYLASGFQSQLAGGLHGQCGAGKTVEMSFQSLDSSFDKLGELRQQLIRSEVSAREKDLRLGCQKGVRELYHGTLFARMLSHFFELPAMEIEAEEETSTDVRLRWGLDHLKHVRQIQLTELVPERLNFDRKSLQQLIDQKALKLAASSDVTLAVFVNRTGGIETVDGSKLGPRGVWFYGCSMPDWGEVFLIGDDPQLGARNGRWKLP